jgi:hypothetical protein
MTCNRSCNYSARANNKASLTDVRTLSAFLLHGIRFTSVKPTSRKIADDIAIGASADAADALADASMTADAKAVDALPPTTKLVLARNIPKGPKTELEAVDAQATNGKQGDKAFVDLVEVKNHSDDGQDSRRKSSARRKEVVDSCSSKCRSFIFLKT